MGNAKGLSSRHSTRRIAFGGAKWLCSQARVYASCADECVRKREKMGWILFRAMANRSTKLFRNRCLLGQEW